MCEKVVEETATAAEDAQFSTVAERKRASPAKYVVM